MPQEGKLTNECWLEYVCESTAVISAQYRNSTILCSIAPKIMSPETSECDLIQKQTSGLQNTENKFLLL